MVYNEPNEDTIRVIKEVKEGKLEGPLDVSSVEAMYKSMGVDGLIEKIDLEG